MMGTSRAIPMGKRRSEGRWPMIRAIRIAIRGSCRGERAFAYKCITNLMALHGSHESGVLSVGPLGSCRHRIPNEGLDVALSLGAVIPSADS
jgi:hypothetical protein